MPTFKLVVVMDETELNRVYPASKWPYRAPHAYNIWAISRTAAGLQAYQAKHNERTH